MPGKENAKKNWKMPAKLQLFVWMGLEDHAKDITHAPLDGEISVFAETVSLRLKTAFQVWKRFKMKCVLKLITNLVQLN